MKAWDNTSFPTIRAALSLRVGVLDWVDGFPGILPLNRGNEGSCGIHGLDGVLVNMGVITRRNSILLRPHFLPESPSRRGRRVVQETASRPPGMIDTWGHFMLPLNTTIHVPALRWSTKTLCSSLPRLKNDFGVCALVSAGDVTWHHGWTLHSSPGNKRDRPRVALAISYFRDGTRLLSDCAGCVQTSCCRGGGGWCCCLHAESCRVLSESFTAEP